MFDGAFLSASGLPLVSAMPGDPVVLDEAAGVIGILTATDLLMAVAVKLPPFWPYNIKTWLVHAES